MGEVTILKGKTPAEVASLLSEAAQTLLPNPGIDENALTSDQEPGHPLIAEIRQLLRIEEGDWSLSAQLRVCAFISDRLSASALAGADF